jgi:hypothetical protein
MDHILREAIEIELHPNSINREDGFYLSRSWKSLICDLREQKTGSKQEHDPLRWALERAISFSQSTPYPGPSLEPNCRFSIGLYAGPIFLHSDWLPSVSPCPSGPICPLFPCLVTSALEDGDSMFLRNVGINQHINTMPKPKN